MKLHGLWQVLAIIVDEEPRYRCGLGRGRTLVG